MSAYSEVVLADSPVSYLQLNDGIGEPVDDGSLDPFWSVWVTDVEGPSLIADPGLSYFFDKWNFSYLESYDELLPTPAEEFSIEFWARPLDIPDGSGGSSGTGFLQFNASNLRVSIQRWDSFLPQAFVIATDQDYWEIESDFGEPLFENGGTYHVVIIWTLEKVKVYVNGVRIDNDDLEPFGELSPSFSSNQWGNAEWGSFPYDGYLDELAIYDYELPEARVMAHYEVGISGGSSGDVEGAASLSASAAISVLARVERRAGSGLSAASALSVSVTAERQAAASASGSASLAVTGLVERLASADWDADSNLSADALAERLAAVALSASGTLAATPDLSIVEREGSALLEASSDFLASAEVSRPASAGLTASSFVLVDGLVEVRASAELVGQALLGVSGSLERFGSASLAATGVLLVSADAFGAPEVVPGSAQTGWLSTTRVGRIVATRVGRVAETRIGRLR